MLFQQGKRALDALGGALEQRFGLVGAAGHGEIHERQIAPGGSVIDDHVLERQLLLQGHHFLHDRSRLLDLALHFQHQRVRIENLRALRHGQIGSRGHRLERGIGRLACGLGIAQGHGDIGQLLEGHRPRRRRSIVGFDCGHRLFGRGAGLLLSGQVPVAGADHPEQARPNVAGQLGFGATQFLHGPVEQIVHAGRGRFAGHRIGLLEQMRPELGRGLGAVAFERDALGLST